MKIGRRPIYRSWIPKAAEEHVMERFSSGAKKIAEYHWNGAIVGYRHFHVTGELSWERPVRNGKLHGTVYRIDTPGELLSTEPYRNGLPHGTARQWANGRLIGSYIMRRGTGIDLWWSDWEDGTVDLAEVHPKKDGDPHGFEWWFSSGRLWSERHWWHGLIHGIVREWNPEGRLRRGYPQYRISGEQMDKQKYLRAARRESTLPPFRAKENEPRRQLPAEIEKAMHGNVMPESDSLKSG